jgi:SAM-dependent methyltransferase
MSDAGPRDAEFDRYARSYEELISEPARDWFAGVDFFHRRKMQVLFELLSRATKSPKDLDWLDFGCGKGDLLRLGVEHFRSAAGCDLSAEMIAACHGIQVKLQSTPVGVPYLDASMDLVTAVCVYHHVPVEEREPLSREIARVLRPGGWFVIVEHNPYNPVTQVVVKRSPVDKNAILLRPRESARLQRASGLTPIAPYYFLYVPAVVYGVLGGLETFLRRVPLGGQYCQVALKPA